MSEQPQQVATLHRRASEWYEQNGSAPEAIRHALAAGDFERAADLVEQVVPEMRRSRQEATLLGWLKALPDDVIQWRPVLSVAFADALLLSGKLEGVEGRLRDAERWLVTTTVDRGERTQTPSPAAYPEQSRRMVVVNQEEFRRLPGSIAVDRAGIALVTGDVPGTMKYARRALDLIPEEDNIRRGAAASLLGLAYWTSGNLEAGHRAYAEGMARLQLAGHISDAIGCALALADIRLAQGRLHEAMTTYERALELATERGGSVLRGTADMYVGMSELHLEYNDLDAATQHLRRSKELGEHSALPQNRYRWCVAMARLKQAQGDLDGALELLHEAERVYMSDFFPNVRPVAALKARVLVAQGRLGEALGWVGEQGLDANNELSYLHEFEHITLARLLLARYKSDRNLANHSILEAMGLLERLLKAAQAGERIGSTLEILLLHALAHQLQGDTSAALVPLEQALMLAEPAGYVRMFVNEGFTMAVLLHEAAKHNSVPGYVRQLRSALGQAEDTTPLKQVLIEPLSARELEVLRLLKTELSGPEIARELTVSLSTLRTHTNNIYLKLGMNNRRAAVRRAEELGLL
jgi:LuxR family maltose regulon positive regulatory protein